MLWNARAIDICGTLILPIRQGPQNAYPMLRSLPVGTTAPENNLVAPTPTLTLKFRSAPSSQVYPNSKPTPSELSGLALTSSTR